MRTTYGVQAHSIPIPNSYNVPISPKFFSDDVIAAAIALLTNHEIETMTRSDMLDTARYAQGVAESPVKADQILDLEDDQLRKVVVLVRSWMRRRINRHSVALGRPPYFAEPL